MEALRWEVVRLKQKRRERGRARGAPHPCVPCRRQGAANYMLAQGPSNSQHPRGSPTGRRQAWVMPEEPGGPRRGRGLSLDHGEEAALAPGPPSSQRPSMQEWAVYARPGKVTPDWDPRRDGTS